MSSKIKLHSGVWFDPLNPDPTLIDIDDIAHALSHLCRFTGHVRYFYSVAEHSFWVSQCVPEDHRLAALLHDASEAYLNDIAYPLKQTDQYQTYREIEQTLQASIYRRFRVPFDLPTPEVEKADRLVYEVEARDLMDMAPDKDSAVGKWLDLTDPMTSEEAKRMFLHRFNQLTTS